MADINLFGLNSNISFSFTATLTLCITLRIITIIMNSLGHYHAQERFGKNFASGKSGYSGHKW